MQFCVSRNCTCFSAYKQPYNPKQFPWEYWHYQQEKNGTNTGIPRHGHEFAILVTEPLTVPEN